MCKITIATSVKIQLKVLAVSVRRACAGLVTRGNTDRSCDSASGGISSITRPFCFNLVNNMKVT